MATVNDALLSQLHPAIISQINAVDVDYASPVGVATLFCADTFQCGIDNKIQTVYSTDEFIAKFGEPNLTKYGQGAYNVLRWLEAGGDAKILRVLPEDAKFAHAIINIKTKILENKKVKKNNGELTTIRNVAIKPVIAYTNVSNNNTDTLLGELEINRPNTYTDGYQDHFIMVVRPKGRGEYYNRFGFRLTINKSFDNMVDARTYNFETISYDEYGNYSVVEGPFYVTFDPDSLSEYNESMFIQEVVNKYSEYIEVTFNTDQYLKVANAINPDVNPYILDVIGGITRTPNGVLDTFYCEDTQKFEDVHVSLHTYNFSGDVITDNDGEPKKNIVDFSSDSEASILNEDNIARKSKYLQNLERINSLKELYVTPSKIGTGVRKLLSPNNTSADLLANPYGIDDTEHTNGGLVYVNLANNEKPDSFNELIAQLTIDPTETNPKDTYYSKALAKVINYIQAFDSFTTDIKNNTSNVRTDGLEDNNVTSYIVSLQEILINTQNIIDSITKLESYKAAITEHWRPEAIYILIKTKINNSISYIKNKLSLFNEIQLNILDLSMDVANTRSSSISVDKVTAIKELTTNFYSLVSDINNFGIESDSDSEYFLKLITGTHADGNNEVPGLLDDVIEKIEDIGFTSNSEILATLYDDIFNDFDKIINYANLIVNIEFIRDTAYLIGLETTGDNVIKIDEEDSPNNIATNITSLKNILVSQITETTINKIKEEFPDEVDPEATITYNSALIELVLSEYNTITSVLTSQTFNVKSLKENTIKPNIEYLEDVLNQLRHTYYDNSLQNFDYPVKFFMGSDGNISYTNEKRYINKKNLLIRAYSGLIDEDVLNRNLVNFDHIIDANYDNSVKLAIADLARNVRKDFFFWCDTGLTNSPQDCLNWREKDFNVYTQYMGIFAQDLVYYDNFTARDLKLTSGYVLANKVPSVIFNNGLQYPIAGPRRGLVDGFKSISWIPNESYKELLYRKKVNYIEQDPKRTKIGSQLTALDKNNPLSNINNMLVLLNMKKNVEQIVANYQFEFNDQTTHDAMSYDLNEFLVKYVENRSCESVTATVSASDYDKKQKIVRVTVTIKFNNVIERIVVSFDVAA